MADFILKNIAFGDTEVDGDTLEPIRTFFDAPLRPVDGEVDPGGDRAVGASNIIVPFFAMEMFHDADDYDTRKSLLPLIKEQQELEGLDYSHKNKDYEDWFKQNTREGQEGMDAWKGDHSFNYPQYYLDGVVENPEIEEVRKVTGEDLPDDYRTKPIEVKEEVKSINPIIGPTDFLSV